MYIQYIEISNHDGYKNTVVLLTPSNVHRNT